MIDAHYPKMIATYTATSLRTFYDTAGKHWRCLRSLGEGDNQMQVIPMFKFKLSCSVIVDLEKIKAKNEQWTVKNFRKLLLRHTNAQKLVIFR